MGATHKFLTRKCSQGPVDGVVFHTKKAEPHLDSLGEPERNVNRNRRAQICTEYMAPQHRYTSPATFGL